MLITFSHQQTLQALSHVVAAMATPPAHTSPGLPDYPAVLPKALEYGDGHFKAPARPQALAL